MTWARCGAEAPALASAARVPASRVQGWLWTSLSGGVFCRVFSWPLLLPSSSLCDFLTVCHQTYRFYRLSFSNRSQKKESGGATRKRPLPQSVEVSSTKLVA